MWHNDTWTRPPNETRTHTWRFASLSRLPLHHPSLGTKKNELENRLSIESSQTTEVGTEIYKNDEEDVADLSKLAATHKQILNVKIQMHEI